MELQQWLISGQIHVIQTNELQIYNPELKYYQFANYAGSF